MKINHASPKRGITTLSLKGSLRIGEVELLQKALDQALHKENSRRIILDMKDLSCVDGTGLTALIRAFQDCKKHSTQLVFANIQKPVTDLFAIVRLLTVFEIHDSLDKAVNATH